MSTPDEELYKDYLETELSRFDSRPDITARDLFAFIAEQECPAILDLGCGAGQELLQFAGQSGILKIGADVAFAAGGIFKRLHTRTESEGSIFINCAGEQLPFANESFDLIICRVALPYMHSETVVKEMSRVLAPKGRIVLTVHAPSFYFRMIRNRIASLSPRQLAYPVICFAGGIWFFITGKQPKGEFWQGKETFHTRSMLDREISACGLRIVSDGPSEGKGGHTYLICKR